ncbi:MAG TPA: hypothetical protein VF719_09640 [Abditibacteriaceae bacterium]
MWMRKSVAQRVVTLGLLLLSARAEAQQKTPSSPVVPGQSVGRVALGDSYDAVRSKMGKPQASQKRTDGFWQDSWFGPAPKEWTPGAQRVFLVIYSNGRVAQINYNGAHFVTSRGISPTSTLQQFRRTYPRNFIRSYLHRYEGGGGHNQYYYDAVRDGIGFTFGTQDYPHGGVIAEELCVHRRGVRVIPAVGGVRTKPVLAMPAIKWEK